MIINENIYTLYYLLKNFYINLEKFDTVIDDYGDKSITDVYISAIRVLEFNIHALSSDFSGYLPNELKDLISKKNVMKHNMLKISNKNNISDVHELLKFHLALLSLQKNILILWNKYCKNVSTTGKELFNINKLQIMLISTELLYVQDLINNLCKNIKICTIVNNDSNVMHTVNFITNTAETLKNNYEKHMHNLNKIRLRDIIYFINIDGSILQKLFKKSATMGYHNIITDNNKLILKDYNLKWKCKKITIEWIPIDDILSIHVKKIMFNAQSQRRSTVKVLSLVNK